MSSTDNPEQITSGTVTYLGHASVLIETNGLRILTDPILRNRISFLRRTSPAIHEAYYTNIDIVLISRQRCCLIFSINEEV